MTQMYNAFYELINSQFAVSPTVVVDPETPDPEIVVAVSDEIEPAPPTDPEGTPENLKNPWWN